MHELQETSIGNLQIGDFDYLRVCFFLNMIQSELQERRRFRRF